MLIKQKAAASLKGITFSVLLLLVFYGLVEWSFPRIYSYLFPVEALQKLEEPYGIWPLLQSSKKHFLPEHPYVALVGDSYAMGMGDYFLDIPNRYRPRFHSAHAIQDLTGLDVISYGSPGSGSIRGLISNPVAGEHYIHKTVNIDMPEPDWVVLYFYEGNDLTENWMYYEKTFLQGEWAQKATPQEYKDPVVFARYVTDIALSKNHLYLAAEASELKDRLLFSRYVRRFYIDNILQKKMYRKKYPGEFGLIYVPESRWVPRKVADPVNRAIIAGKDQALPDNLQGPAMDLSPMQLQNSVDTLDLSLAYARQYFQHSKLVVVYIPSVISTYDVSGAQVSVQNLLDDNTLFDVAASQTRSAWIRQQVKQICEHQNVRFLDVTTDLQAAAKQEMMHGPQDWNHLGKKGYQVLGESVVRQMGSEWPTVEKNQQ